MGGGPGTILSCVTALRSRLDPRARKRSGQGNGRIANLLDLPTGSARVLAIEIIARGPYDKVQVPQQDFEHVVDAATPTVESIELHAPSGGGAAIISRVTARSRLDPVSRIGGGA